MAQGAERIAAARKAGKKPADMVIVSMCGLLDERNPQVLVNWKDDYEWWWVRGLQIAVHTKAGAPWKKTLMAIAAHRPAKLLVWDVERHQGADVYRLPTLTSLEAAKSSADWRWELDLLPWLPFENANYENENTGQQQWT
jgi:hypothetical protein